MKQSYFILLKVDYVFTNELIHLLYTSGAPLNNTYVV